MRSSKALLLAIPVLVLAVSEARDAAACGGCFVQQTESTQVTGHKMVLSISNVQTTLWDQIEYSGEPSSFAWVLPIHGVAEIGVSSDALFQTLEGLTEVVINSPSINCTPPCGNQSNFAGGDFEGGGGAGGGYAGGVTVLAHDVVGPYETVQLQSTNPAALEEWLADKGYAVPSDIYPIIDAYVGEGFNFLAMKLVPGAGINAMKPVRITTQGASPVLPLRMVAAGTGAITPITLWVLGEGRYQTANLPTFQIDGANLVWSWQTQSSNYSLLKQAGFENTNNTGWLVEAGEPLSSYGITDNLLYLAEYDAANSGYGDDQHTPLESATADMDKLFGSIPDTSLWVTRLHGELSRAALNDDLLLEASPDQAYVERYFEASVTIGEPPPCPPQPPCDEGNVNGGFGFFGSNGPGGGGGTCAMSFGGGVPWLGALALAAALALVRRRRR